MISSSTSAFLYAIALGKISDVRLWLTNPYVNVNTEEGMPLRTAILEGYSDIAVLLLGDPRVDPSLANNAALRLAIDKNNIELIKELLEDDRVIRKLKNDKIVPSHSVSLSVVKLIYAATCRA